MKITAPKGWSNKPFDKVVFPTQAEYDNMPEKYRAMVDDNGGYLTKEQDEDMRFDAWCDKQPVNSLCL